jgi:hypothetical protein
MRAAMWLGTCGLLRGGEFLTKSTTTNVLQLRHLTFYDADNSEVDPISDTRISPKYMSIRLEQSKTDPFREGVTVFVSNERAIGYMLQYLRHRGAGLRRMPLFVDPSTGQALTAAALVKFTQGLMTQAKIPNADRFLGHSFRKGGATSLHEAGQPDSLIKTMGRWASFAFATYIHTPLLMLLEAGRSLRKVEDVLYKPSTSVPSSFWDVNNLV